ncbi:cytochrome P450 monooxygenase [Melampsora larici-populina 98AG31]|uniref:Cytochrome P450 monooxygenase n=1 Tax=Melampsora larici-populina (strain 98AG31 / pathotype 3-4-7) TaxID=747676 RepID=F4R4N9_MELLP|nr:cytochrome P450 monooxygenase [Melampsora larici-populina 98AG31]EGG12967.1 cytochrome P450 monooxygenase [Melampsora larici-populina 98AG31]
MSNLHLQFDRYLNPVGSFDGLWLLTAFVILGIAYKLFLRPLLSPLSRLPGPKNPSVLFGNLAVTFGLEGGLRQWHKDIGPTLRLRGFFGNVRLSTIDPKALNHILVSRAYAYPKSEATRRSLGNLLGRGLLFAEGETHRRQKRLLGPVFSPVQIRELAPVVYEYAFLLRDKWADLIRNSQKPYLVINVLPWLSRATLDIIGSAGFGYQFKALEDNENSSAMGKAFQDLTSLSGKGRTPLKILIASIIRSIPPSLRLYQPKSMKIVDISLQTMENESRALLSHKKKEAEAGGLLGGKDLISVLVRANTMSEEGSLSDEEVISQMTTFLFAGHETTATSLTWMLWILAKHPDVQDKLRKELQEASAAASQGEEQIPIEQLTSLTYLDAVCRETLRFLPPVAQTAREASMADTIPVSGDGDPIHIAAGEEIIISISAFNLSKDVFGPDAEVFRPDRWIEKDPVGSLPGIWSGLLTFLGGPRACIGYRFTLMELKVLVAVIICHFRFEERDGLGCGPEIERRVNIVMRPQVKNEDIGVAMPLRVSLVEGP